MSNQVYISQYQKYLPSVGPNIFVTSAPQASGSGQTQAIVFDEVNIAYDAENFTVNLSNGNVEILQDGIYNISAFLHLEDAVSPTANDINYGAWVLYTPTATTPLSTYQLGLVINRVPARGGATGSDSFSCTVNATMYAKAGSIFTVYITNFAGTTLNVGDVSTLTVQRIA